MKRLLALVLAMVLTLSVAVIASADFTDALAINPDYSSAVKIMSSIGVINGFEDSSFGPQKTLTRAQAAKIICYILEGENTSALTASTATFTDVPADNWASPFVEYCAAKGIVAGVGGGKFNPSGELTGYAFAKMLLVTLGFDASVLTGEKWAEVTETSIREFGLAGGVPVSGSQITREQACQLALNFLLYGATAQDTLLYTTFQVTKEVSQGEKLDYYRPFATYTSEEDGKYWPGKTLSMTDTPIAVFTDRFTANDLYEALGREDDTITIFRNTTSGSTKMASVKGATEHFDRSDLGFRYELYFNAGTEEIILIAVTNFFGKIKSVSNGTVTLENDLTFQTGDFTASDVGSYVIYQANGNNSWKIPGVITAMQKATIVTGKLEAASQDTVKVDGKTYQFLMVVEEVLGGQNGQTYLASGKIGDNVSLVTDSFGAVYTIFSAS